MTATTRDRLVPWLGLLLAACARVPTPATRSPGSPAQAATPPATPVLTSEAEEQPAPAAQTSPEMEMHQGHVMPGPSPSATPNPPGTEYTCPMHPRVKAERAGTCPICGMTLVKKVGPQGFRTLERDVEIREDEAVDLDVDLERP